MPSSLITMPLLISTQTGGIASRKSLGDASERPRSSVAVFRTAKDDRRKLELTVVDHPTGPGVLVSDLGNDGACAMQGLLVGHHILKINDTRTMDHRSAIELTDAAEGDVQFSLGGSLCSYTIDRAVKGCTGDIGITLVNNSNAGVGVVVVHVAPGLAAYRAGIEVGHEIVAVGGQLAWDHKAVINMIDSVVGSVELTVSARKITEANVLNQHIGQCPVDVIVTA